MQQSEYVNPSSPEVKEGFLTKVPPITTQLQVQWQQISTNIFVFLIHLPEYIGRFFQEYKQPIITVVLILTAAIAVKVFLAILHAFNNIPLLAPSFELIGIGYSAWFANRYLLKASKRQELAQELQKLKQQVVGG